jgi:hypothetical protein
MLWRELLDELAADQGVWMLAGVGVLIVVLLVGGWLRTWWSVNLPRNHLEAKRRLRREGRDNERA